MAIKAKSKGFDLKGIYLNIEKVMTQNSERKIKELIIDIFILTIKAYFSFIF